MPYQTWWKLWQCLQSQWTEIDQLLYIKEKAFHKQKEQSLTYSSQMPMASRSSECCATETKVLATMAPLAATAGTPMPGKVESPQQNSCRIGVEWPGKVPFPAFIAGPYVPRFLLRNLRWVSGVPTNFTSHLSRLNPGPRTRSTALHITWNIFPEVTNHGPVLLSNRDKNDRLKFRRF